MKPTALLTWAALSLAALTGLTAGAQTPTQPLPHFDKIVVSPLIELVLEPGHKEGVRLEYTGVAPAEVHHEVEGKTLRLYLGDARLTVRNRKYWRNDEVYREPVYGKGVRVTAYVTYRQLRYIEKRGEENVTCKGPLNARRLTLRLFGEVDAQLASVEARRFKASLFGENKLTVGGGGAARQRYRSFGENEIDTRDVAGAITSTSLFGNSRLHLNASDEIRVTAIGESDVRFTGGGHLSKRLVIGEASISRLH